MVDQGIKAELTQEMEDTIKAVRSVSGGVMGFIPGIGGRCRRVSEACIELEKKLNKPGLSDDDFSIIRVKHEANMVLWNRTFAITKTYPAIVVLILIAYAAYRIVVHW